MSATERGLFQAILTNPADDTARLIYADWLDDNGQGERAEFIRTQIFLAQSEPCDHVTILKSDCQRCEASLREGDLLAEHGNEWMPDLPGDGWRWCRPETLTPHDLAGPHQRRVAFIRGFAGHVLLMTDDFCDIAHLLPECIPLERVRLTDRFPGMNAAGQYCWTCFPQYREQSHQLPTHLFDNRILAWRDPGCQSLGTEDEGWDSAADAFAALSAACVESARNCRNKFGTRKVFTTGQVAKFLQVSPQTVVRWFDSGKLRGYRVPGSQDRRIPADQLVCFVRENGFFAPVPKVTPTEPTPLPSPEDQAAAREGALARLRVKKVLSTGEIARILNVAPRTIVKWIDAGRLPIDPSSGKRRLVARESLIHFMEEHKFPTAGLV